MKEMEALYQDIQNLNQQIHQLEEAVAALIYTLMFKTIYGAEASVQTITKEELIRNAERFRNIPISSQKTIKEFGADRDFIEMFINPSKKQEE